jgi:hypothetical protein
MSRPYVNINSVSYNSTNDVLTLDITALRLRGASTLSIGGLTASGETQTISLSDGYYNSSSFTFSANIEAATASGLPSTATFTPATAQFEFSGTASGGATKTNVKISLWPGPVNVFGAGGYTFSGVGGTQAIATALATLNANVSAVPVGVTSSVSGNTLIFTAPSGTGKYYNGNDAKISSGTNAGSLGFTFSASKYSGTWDGGVTTLSLTFSCGFGEFATEPISI